MFLYNPIKLAIYSLEPIKLVLFSGPASSRTLLVAVSSLSSPRDYDLVLYPTESPNTIEQILISLLAVLMDGEETWIGLTDSESEGTFKWVTGQNISYNAWDSGIIHNRY